MNKNQSFFFILIIILLVSVGVFQFLQFRNFTNTVRNLDNFIENFDQQEYSAKSSEDANEGDWLVWAFAVEPKTLNQISVERDIYARWICVDNIFEPLLKYDYDSMEMVEHLADNYEISEDGLRITFQIRDQAKFSDGVPVTADDVIFTYETIIDPRIDAADLSNLFIDVEKVSKIDEKTVSFQMKRPYFKSLEVVSFWDIGIYPKHIYQFEDPKEFNQRVSNPVGSGPYVFEKWDIGSEIVFRRNENYWGQKPKLKKLVWRFISNDIARMQALKSGQVDMIIPLQDQYAELVNDAKFNENFRCVKYWNPGVPFFYIGWNQRNPLFEDKMVRRAMTHMVDRPGILKHLLKDLCEPVTGPFYVKGGQYDQTVEPWPYDLEKAAELLKAAGWTDTDGDGILDKNGEKFSFKFMYDSSNSFYNQLVKMVKDSAEKIGVEVIPDPYEWSIIMSKLPERDFDAVSLGWGGDILQDPYQLWHSSQADNRGSNYVGFKNPQADELIEQIRVTLDENKRNQLSKQLHRLLHDKQPYTFLYARPTFRILDKRFENVKVHKLGFNILEWYVPWDKQKY